MRTNIHVWSRGCDGEALYLGDFSRGRQRRGVRFTPVRSCVDTADTGSGIAGGPALSSVTHFSEND
eukprot:2870334-Prymnesium_polylepis.1